MQEMASDYVHARARWLPRADLMRLVGVALIFSSAFLAVRCAGDSDDSQQADDGSSDRVDDAVAAALLLRLDDLPGDSSETSDTSLTAGDLFDACAEGPRPGLTGIAQTAEFSMGSAKSFSQSVSIFHRTAKAQAVHDQLPTILACVVEAIETGGLDTAESTFGDVSLTQVAFTPFGDRLDAYRIQFHLRARGDPASASVEVRYIDFVLMTEGNYASVIRATSRVVPFDHSLLQELAQKVAVRLPAR